MTNTSIRTLFITKHPPYPPVGGSPLRNWQNISTMMNFGPVAIFSISFDRPTSNADLPPDITIYNYYNVNEIRKQRSFKFSTVESEYLLFFDADDWPIFMKTDIYLTYG